MYLESTVRQSLQAHGEALPDYQPDGKTSVRPTAKTMLARICFRGVNLAEDWEASGRRRWRLYPLPLILRQMLRHLQMDPACYERLIE